MPLRAILASRDSDIITVFRRMVPLAGMELTVVTSSDDAKAQLNAERFEAVLVDCDDLHQAPEILRDLRTGKSNPSSFAFAITNRITDRKTAYQLGANLVLEKPITADQAANALRAAYGIIVEQRRRYFRVPVNTVAYLLYEGKEFPVEVTNISEGGMAVAHLVEEKLPSEFKITFTLPGSQKQIRGRAQMAWRNSSGEAGMRFLSITTQTRPEFTDWLDKHRGEEPMPIVRHPVIRD